jgi:hypothetical protein
MVDVCDEAPDFSGGFGIREFEVREFLASGIPDIPICDELLLPGISPYRLDHSPYDLSLCDRGPTFHRDFGVLDDTMFVSTKLAIPRNPMAYGR